MILWFVFDTNEILSVLSYGMKHSLAHITRVARVLHSQLLTALYKFNKRQQKWEKFGSVAQLADVYGFISHASCTFSCKQNNLRTNIY
jgi:hypothetical protein